MVNYKLLMAKAVLFCALATAFLGCSGDPKKDDSAQTTATDTSANEGGGAEETPTTAAVVVLCDVSNSVSVLVGKNGAAQGRVADMINGCKQLIRHYPPGTNIRFFLISSNAFETPFFEINTREVYATDKQEVLDELLNGDKKIERSIGSAAVHAENNTCILTSIENGYTALAAKNASSIKTKELILFSDMLEQCHDTPADGPVMMHTNADVLLAPDQLDRFVNYKGSNTFNAGTVGLRVIMTTPYMPQKTARQIKDAWQKLFKNMGAKPALAGSLIFEPASNFSTFADYAEE